ncbi:MAG: FISUMP domain-containing protein [Bacteroidales bacterium]
MKAKITFAATFLSLLSLLFSCNLEEVKEQPAVETGAVIDITATTAGVEVNILRNGGAPIITRGVYWSSHSNPTAQDNIVEEGSGKGEFVATITGLTPKGTYYARGFATNSIGTTMGEVVTFITQSSLATIETLDISVIRSTSAQSGGTIVSDGGSTITAKGVCWSTQENPTIEDSKSEDGEGDDPFTSEITGLNANETYYVRAYATNTRGTAYGQQVSFTTQEGIAYVTTSSITSVTSNSATVNSEVIDDSGFAVTERGIVWGTSPSPTIESNREISGSGVGQYSVELTNLLPNVKYFVRSYAINSKATAYGEELSFTTNAELPLLTTKEPSSVIYNAISTGGTISYNGGADITHRGVCWSTSPNPTVDGSFTSDGTGIGTFTSQIEELQPATTYYLRAYATNIAGTGYGQEVEVTTLPVLRFTIPNFTDSRVYKITYNGVQYGEVAKEYLRRSTTFHAQAVIAYPSNNLEEPYKSNLTNGFVAQLLLLTNNAGDSQTIGAVHGGKVAFNLESGELATYSEGSSANPFTTLYLPVGGEITGDPIAGSVEATVEADIITDIRGDESNIYPVVKIGIQYWMGKNLNTTKYNSTLGYGDIPTNISDSEWSGLNLAANYSPAVSVHGYPDANSAEAQPLREKLGVLYSYLAISGASSIAAATFDANGNMEDNLSPQGWIVPTKGELDMLYNYMGNVSTYTKRLREFLDESGVPTNISGKEDENITGFAARNGSYRNHGGNFVALGNANGAFFWSRTKGTDDPAGKGWSLNLVSRYEQQYMRAFSIRSIRK